MQHRRENEDIDADFARVDAEPAEASDDAAYPVPQSPIAGQEIDTELGFASGL